ncbi:SDR family NAD(P)-dependent oxidoreductase [Sinomicrobium sp.]
MEDLKGKVALVTGSGRGLGKGIALVLAEKGADIFINDLKLDDAVKEVVETIRVLGRKCIFIKADVTSEEEVKSMFESIYSEYGRLDILVNNAGTDKSQDIFATSLSDWEFIMKTNITSCFLCSKYAMEIMKKKGGSIVNVSSVVGHQGALKGHVHYSASKSGIFGVTKALARTGATFGIRVNAIAPGVIETELSRTTHGEEGMKKLGASIPLGLGNTRDVGLSVAFLCGEGGRYITGITLDINGGLYFR